MKGCLFHCTVNLAGHYHLQDFGYLAYALCKAASCFSAVQENSSTHSINMGSTFHDFCVVFFKLFYKSSVSLVASSIAIMFPTSTEYSILGRVFLFPTISLLYLSYILSYFLHPKFKKTNVAIDSEVLVFTNTQLNNFMVY